MAWLTSLGLPLGLLMLARPATGEEQVWLEVSAPHPDAFEVGPIGLIEVQGWAGVGEPAGHDVVIVLDTSGSTARASGIDVDGDGRVGRATRSSADLWRSFNPRRLSSDPDDTILAAERVATRRLVDLLDPERTRIGLVSFHSKATLETPVGSSREQTMQALERLDRMFASGWTNLAEATRMAVAALLQAPERAGRRRRSVLILSDGYPTSPPPERKARSEALDAGREAADMGIRIFSFTLGLVDEAQDRDVFREMAEATGGSLTRVQKPGEIVTRLPEIRLADVAHVTVENRTTGQSGRAIRIFPDGSFDGYAPLAPGENLIVVTAQSTGGESRSLERTVFFEKRRPRTVEEATLLERRLERLSQRLRDRTVETQLLRELEAVRAAETDRSRELTIETERRGSDPEPP